MPESTTSSPGVQAQLRHVEQKNAAAAAVLAGRLTEAHRLILDLIGAERPVTAGQCRYCGCTDDHGCAIVVPADELGDAPVVARCSWWDEARTVCSKLSCIRRFEREQTAGDAIAAPPSRIVVP